MNFFKQSALKITIIGLLLTVFSYISSNMAEGFNGLGYIPFILLGLIVAFIGLIKFIVGYSKTTPQDRKYFFGLIAGIVLFWAFIVHY